MHIFQKHILDQLRQAPSVRYSQLQPDGVESSHFMYHLKQLIKDGLVEQQSRGVYRLTGKGKAAVDRMSADTVNPHQTPKVITYTLLEDAQNFYLYRKDKEPYRDLLNMIGGKVHISERTAVAAVREVHEKTGLAIPPPQLAAIAEIQISNTDTLLSHVIAYVYRATVDAAAIGDTPLEAITKKSIATHPDLAPDFLPILDKLPNDATPATMAVSVTM